MTNRLIRRMLELGSLLGDMVMSGAGCLLVAHGFREVAMVYERPEATPSLRANTRSMRRFDEFGAALLLLAFITHEAAAMILAFHR